ncbi:MAG: polysaccharide biosynthesis protein [Candidatus Limnocylindrales bacterium]
MPTAPLRAIGWSATTRAAILARRIRGRHLLVLDVLAISAAIYLSLSLRRDGFLPWNSLVAYLPVALLPLLVRPIINDRFGLYRRLWGHASVPDLTQIIWATVASTVICLIAFYGLLTPAGLAGTVGFPRGFWIAEMVLSLGCIGGTRFFIRAVNDAAATVRISGSTVSLAPALLYGAGREGAMMARSAMRDPRGGVIPVGFLDDDANRQGATIAGLPVFGGLDHLGEAARMTGARMLLITMPTADGVAIRRVMDRAQHAGLEVRTVPDIHELIDGSLTSLRIRRVKVEDLLAREQVTTHAPGVEETVRDRVVMVTGAGGSIGSELARQLYGFHPRLLVLVDRAESPLYMIQRELEARALSGRGGGELSIHLTNVASREAIGRLIEETGPAVIFHAAACKHVPMMEEHPSEGVQVNIGGTLAVLSAAVQAGVPRFVLVSTDKAVEPSSVMGATKRVAEWLVADAARVTGRAYVSVRFGNVLGSTGSVLPIFQTQLENGEPLTVTHPEMTRYFMTIQEAGWLILDAAAIGDPGDLFVLDMGEPVKIVDMARDLIRLSGQDEDRIPIRFTGLRPGEKLTEKLFYETETVQQTDVTKILRVLDAPPPADVRERARQLVSIAHGDTDETLRDSLFDFVARRSGPEAGSDSAVCPTTLDPARSEPRGQVVPA